MNMLKMLQLLFLLLCQLDQKFVTAPKNLRPPPRDPRWHGWAEAIVNKHLTNMTEELLKDTTLKLEQAKQIQMSYMFTMSYELGTITAHIQDDFAHMLAIYREYADIRNFVNKKYSLYKILKAYHIIQGDYNKIRYEKTLFYKVLDKHQKIREERDQLHKQHIDNSKGFGGGPSRGRKRRTFRSNSTILNQEERWMDSIDHRQKAQEMQVAPRLQHRESAADDDLPPRRVMTKTTPTRLWRQRDEQFGRQTHSNF